MTAPVVIFVYNRKSLLEQTLTALGKNTLAKQTDIFLYCDGAKNEKDWEAVDAVREYVQKWKEKNPFRTVKIIFRERNWGLAHSVIDGVTQVIQEQKRVIVVEDDLLTAPDFLTYMNQALDYYEGDPHVWSVSGYSPGLKVLKRYQKDVFLYPRACSWGWGTWLDRWETVDWDVTDFDQLASDPKKIRALNRGGDDMFEMLQSQRQGKNDSWAIRWCYAQSKKNMGCIYPTKSRVQNIGCAEGTHFHDKYDNRYRTELSDGKKECCFAYCEYNTRILRQFRFLYSKSLAAKIKRKCRRIMRRIEMNTVFFRK